MGQAWSARRDELAARLAVLDALRQEITAELDTLGGRVRGPAIGLPRLTTLQRAAAIAGVHPDTLKRWREFDTFAQRLGGRWSIDLDALEGVLRGRLSPV